jgi:hypothetical protein
MTRPTQKRRRRPQRYSNIHEQITDLVENMAEVSEVALALALIRAMIAQEL